LGVSAPLITLISAFAMLIAGGAAPLAAMDLGRGKLEEAEKTMGTAFASLTVMGILLMLLGYTFLEEFLRIFGASDNTMFFAKEYTSIYILGTIFVMMSLGMNLFISSQGKSKNAMVAVLIGAITNIILDPIFIFLLGMGIKGAALATIFSQLLSAIYVLKYLISKKTLLRLKKEYIRIDFLKLGFIVALGVSTFVMRSTESAINIVFNNQLLKYGGDMYVGAMTIMQSAMMLIIVPLSGYIYGVQPVVSFNYGAGKIHRVKETIVVSLLFLTGISVTYYLIAASNPHIFASFFTSDPLLTGIVTEMLPIFMLGTSLFAIQMTAQMFFVGTGQAKTSLFIALFRKVIMLIPLALIFPKFYGVSGVYYSEPVADLISIAVCSILLIKGMKQLNNYEAEQLAV
ncbi:MAG: MATE family efflux transporter, partial [Sedimentibacter sp.]